MRLCHLNMRDLAECSLSVQEMGILRVRTIYLQVFYLVPTKVQSHSSIEGKQSENCFGVRTQRVFSVLKSINQTLLSPPSFSHNTRV